MTASGAGARDPDVGLAQRAGRGLDRVDDRAPRRPPRRDADRGRHRRQDRHERPRRRRAAQHPRPPRRRPARRRARSTRSAGSVLDEADGAVAALEMVAAADVSASSAVTIVTDEDGGDGLHRRGLTRRPGLRDAGRPRRPRPHEPLPRAPRPRRRHRPSASAPGTILRLDLARRRMAAMPAGADRAPTPSWRRWRRIAAARARCAATPSPARRSETGGRPSPPWSPSPPCAELRVHRGGPCQIAAASTTAAAAKQ